MPPEDKLWLPPLSPEVQQKLDRLRSIGKKSTTNRTGFAGKTLWDWIQFFAVLAIPIIVAAGTLYFTQQITQQQAQLSIASNERQHQTDIQITADQQRETNLQSYLVRMSDLLLNHNLGTSNQNDEVSQVARAETLAAIQELDPKRKGDLLQFLYEARLIGYLGKPPLKPIIDLSHADMSDTYALNIALTDANLNRVDLSGANLSYSVLNSTEMFLANLSHADLTGAKLDGAYLSSPDLSVSVRRAADLSKAHLYTNGLADQDLSGADLRGAEFFGTNLTGADLFHAQVTTAQLALAKSLKGATMPDGSIHP